MRLSRLLSLPLCVVLGVSVIEIPAIAAPLTPSEPSSSYSPSDYSLGMSEHQIEAGLEVIYSIPDEVLERGEEATAVWVQQNLTNNTIALFGVTEVGCIASITWAIGSALIPIAKIKKIKALVKELGGVRAAVAKLREQNFSWPSIQQTGGALRDLGSEILGVAGVAEYCFNQ